MKESFKLFLCGILLWEFTIGMEHSLALATINQYVLSTGAPQNSLGFVLTATAVGAVISAPIFG